MDILSYLTPIAALSGLILSAVSILYTRHQNIRNIDVHLKLNDKNYPIFEDPCDSYVELSAFNSGYRSVTVIGYEFTVDGEIIHFTCENYYEDPKENTNIIIRPNTHDYLPYHLKEGETTKAFIKVGELALVLSNIRINKKKLSGKVKLSGYFETAENKKYWSEPFEFDIEGWLMCA